MTAETVKKSDTVLGLHDNRCARFKGHSCNCPMAAFLKKDKSCGHRTCMKKNTQCPVCGRVNGKEI